MPELAPLTDDQLDAYLDRLGVDRSADLGSLQAAHLRAVPFENLSIHLGEPIELSTQALFDKIVTRRRGGFCYELNGLLAVALRGLGHRVDLLAACVWGGERYGVPLDHVALRVDDNLLDVGFGRFSLRPLRLEHTGEQLDEHGTFSVREVDGDLVVEQDSTPQYRLERHPREMSDFVPMCWWQQTGPTSHFRKGPVCSIATPTGGQLTLSGRLIVSTEGGERTETELRTDADVLAAYDRHFGVVLDTVPTAPAT